MALWLYLRRRERIRRSRVEDRSEKEGIVYGAGEDAECGGDLQKRVERADV